MLICGPRSDDPRLVESVAAGAPTMVIGDPGLPDCPSVDIDNVEAARRAAAHLIEHGYQRIGLITHEPLAFVSSQARIAGYRQTLAEANVDTNDDWIVEGERCEASGLRAIEQQPYDSGSASELW